MDRSAFSSFHRALLLCKGFCQSQPFFFQKTMALETALRIRSMIQGEQIEIYFIQAHLTCEHFPLQGLIAVFQHLFYSCRSFKRRKRRTDSKIWHRRGSLQSQERETITQPTIGVLKAKRLGYPVKFGMKVPQVLSIQDLCSVKDCFLPKVGASQMLPFRVELTLRNQAASAGVEPDNLPILLIECWDLC